MNPRKIRQVAFTLIELMVTVAIVGILAAIVYPSFMDQVRKGKRAEGKVRLSQSAQLLERYYSDNNSYSMVATNFPTLFGLAAGTTVYSGSNNETNSPYTISFGSTASTYALSAVAVGAQASDTKCGNFGLNNIGVKSITGTGAVKDCW
jgi:type IV pilus assembly protein PilE